jgi:hypothetical protein
MTLSTNSDWLDLCRECRIDPGTALDPWFRFYHMQKAFEAGGETGPPPSGCSVEGGAANNTYIQRPGQLSVQINRKEALTSGCVVLEAAKTQF